MIEWKLLDNIILAKVKQVIATKYENPNVISTDIDTFAIFPTIKVKIVAWGERGQDLSGLDINAVEPTVQVDVFTNKSASEAENITYLAINALKEMRFHISSMPIATKEGDVFRSTIRAKRVVGGGDILFN